MLEIFKLILILQIGFNAALNYNGHNYKTQNPNLFSHAQPRRNIDSWPLVDSEGDSDGSDDYPSYDDFGYRRHQFQNQFHSRRNNLLKYDSVADNAASLEQAPVSRMGGNNFPNAHQVARSNFLRYDTRADNEASLEAAPVGRTGTNNFANLHQFNPSLSNLDSRNRRQYLSHRRPSKRSFQDHRFSRRQNNGRRRNDLSLDVDENSSEDYNVDHLGDDRAQNLSPGANYLRSLLTRMQFPNTRRNDNDRFFRREDNDFSFNSPLNPEFEEADNQPSLRSLSLEDSGFLDSFLSYIDQEVTPFDDTESYDSLKSLRSNLRFTNSRRNGNQDSLNAYIDALLHASAENNPNFAAFDHPKLRSPEATFSRRLYDGSVPEFSSNDQLNTDNDISSLLSPFRGLKPRLRSRKAPKNNLNDLNNETPQSKSNLRRNNDELEHDLFQNDRLSPSEDDSNLSVIPLSYTDYLSVDPLEPRRFDQNQQKNRRDGSNYALSSNDRLSADDETSEERFNDFTLEQSSLRSGKASDQTNPRGNDAEDASLDNFVALRSENSDESSEELPYLVGKQQPSGLNDDREDDTLLYLTDKVTPDDAKLQNPVPYHEKNRRKHESSHRRNNHHFHSVRSKDKFTLNNNDEREALRSKSSDNFDFDSSLPRNSNNFRRRNDGLELKFPIPRKGSDESNKTDSDVLHLEFPWNNQQSPDDNDNSESLRNLRQEHSNAQKKEQSIDKGEGKSLRNYELHLEYPWDGKTSPDSDAADKKSAKSPLRSKNRNSTRNSKDRKLKVIPLRTNHDDNFNNQLDLVSFLRQENTRSKNQRSLAKKTKDDETDNLLDSSEGVSDFTAVPIDRRPARLKKNDDSRRSHRRNAPLETTTAKTSTY